MIYCHVYETWREAQYYFSEYVKENGKELIKTNRMYLMTLDREGNRHYFMPFDRYLKWRLGRTYMWGDTMYHSGAPMEG